MMNSWFLKEKGHISKDAAKICQSFWGSGPFHPWNKSNFLAFFFQITSSQRWLEMPDQESWKITQFLGYQTWCNFWGRFSPKKWHRAMFVFCLGFFCHVCWTPPLGPVGCRCRNPIGHSEVSGRQHRSPQRGIMRGHGRAPGGGEASRAGVRDWGRLKPMSSLWLLGI